MVGVEDLFDVARDAEACYRQWNALRLSGAYSAGAYLDHYDVLLGRFEGLLNQYIDQRIQEDKCKPA